MNEDDEFYEAVAVACLAAGKFVGMSRRDVVRSLKQRFPAHKLTAFLAEAIAAIDRAVAEGKMQRSGIPELERLREIIRGRRN